MSLESCDVKLDGLHVPRMVGEFLLMGCFALGCAAFGCGIVYLAAKIRADPQDSTEDTQQ